MRYMHEDDRPMIEGKTVFEAEPIYTGLLDSSGRPIFRARRPIGFLDLRQPPQAAHLVKKI